MKKLNSKSLFIVLIFVIPDVLIYSAFFTGKILSWGDAPFYFPENLKELFNIPFTWDIRSSNFGAPQFFTLWLYLPTFLAGVLNNFFGLQSQVLLRLLFYFPATLLTIFGSWIFLSEYTQNKAAKVLGTVLYSFNTYILLLIDGGQIGVALAYGLFPLLIHILNKHLKTANTKNFLLSLTCLFLLSNIDLRIFLISLFFILILKLAEYFSSAKFSLIKKEFLYLSILILAVVGLDMFWIVPFVYGLLNHLSLSSESTLNSNLITILNGLFLFQPNFPLNEFGKALPTPFYFVLLPLLIFLGLFLNNNRKYLNLVFIFLFLIFLVKGNNEPLGVVYSFLTTQLPLGIAFRDSSKFFIPLFLVAALLLSLSIESLSKFFKERFYYQITIFLVYLYLLILIYPSFLGGLSGGLNNLVDSNSFFNIYSLIKVDSSFFRTLWFSERPPLGYSSWTNPGVSANELFKDHPLASQIEGSYDLFGYLHSSHLKEWFNLLGIKYVFFPQAERQKSWTPKQLAERGEFLYFINQIPFLKPSNLDTSFPAYKIEGELPHIFAQKKLFIVLGSEKIYEYLFQIPDFNLASQGFIFLEEGKINPQRVFELNKTSADLLVFDRNKDELPFVFLQSKMISTLNATLNEWAKNSSGEYLNWKANLLEHGINALDFDYGLGVSYSTIKGEKIRYKLDVNKRGDYILALRYANSSESSGIKIKLDSFEKEVKNEDSNDFHWNYFEIPNLEVGSKLIEVTNLGSTTALNTILLADKNEYLKALTSAQELETRFKLINLNSKIIDRSITKELDQDLLHVDYKMIDPTRYIVNMPKQANWLTFTDHYNEGWTVNGNKAYPFYAMVNGFYLGNVNSNTISVDLLFQPQKIVIDGIILSIISFFIVSLAALLYKVKRKSQL